jgi:hypothetical protein
VRRDVVNLVVTDRHARDRYGVVLDVDGAVDADATTAARTAIRDQRRATASRPAAHQFATGQG